MLLVLVLAVSAYGQGTGKARIEGEWKGEWDKTPVALNLTAKGKDLTGTFKNRIPCGIYCSEGQTTAEATADIQDGKVDGVNLRFKCDVPAPEGRSFTVTFQGVVQGDRLTLTPQGSADIHPFVLKRN